MAEQKLDKEAEDVLSSIRRLVSQTPDMRARTRKPAEEAADKLVLTPALRVEEPDLTDFVPEGMWSLEDRIAELEAAVGAGPDEWEPDGSEAPEQETPRKFVFQHRPLRDALEAPPLPVADAPVDVGEDPGDVERGAAAQPVVRAAAAEEPAPDLTAESGMMDPDVLRDLVAEIVRQELRGELGERVTRNIRKLVRREIHRALMSRDFD